MSNMDLGSIISKYNRWVSKAKDDPDLVKELNEIKGDEKKIADAFYKDLEFGTGGLRGVIGAGTNRINIYTVAKATQGLCDYIIHNFKPEERVVAISRDSRIKSDVFAYVAARVFAANKIKVHIYKEISPVPTLSFATRYLKCCTGVMITASHNPSKYNRYKVYGKDGCQITTEAAKEILAYINKIDAFDGYKIMPLEDAFKNGQIQYIKNEVYTSFIENTKNESLLGDENVDKNIAIVYSPLNGSGLVPIKRALSEMGFGNIIVVKEQEQPDGNFPTCPYPNPEIKEALELGLKYCKDYNADLMLATDPDCDRVGIAVKDKNGKYVLLSGNQVGLLLFEYVCERRKKIGTMPKHPVMIKTIVTMDLAEKIAKNYGVDVINVLTGFKFIGEQIGLLEANGREKDYIFGFEESYGYLTGTYVRDKDAVNGACMIAEMFAYYKSKGISLLEKLDDIWNKYGYCLNTLHSYEFEGPEGFMKMNQIMKDVRSIRCFNNKKIVEKQDYLLGLFGLPKSDVVKFLLEGNCSIVVRPSGTEPKLKIYISVNAKNELMAKEIENAFVLEFENKFIYKGEPK